ncbi:MAG TPA: PhoH family protein [Thermoanaerobacterales bacterium]|nr:PhoH family protein [Thermoanaerobacterales bacterium]
MEKIYVLDTSVLLSDPNAFFSFEDNDVVIPAVVIEEVDSKKSYQDEIGRNARRVSRILDNFRNMGKLHEGIPLEGGGTFRVELNHKAMTSLADYFLESNNDNRILAVAKNLQMEENQKPQPKRVILVSKDAIMRVKADALGVEAQDYLSDKIVTASDFFQGYVEKDVHPSIIDMFYMDGNLSVEHFGEAFHPNQFVILRDVFGSSKSALGRYALQKKSIVPLYHAKDAVWGIRPKNAQQKMAFDLLLNDEISLVTITGRAGTGKTLLALAAGLLKTEDEKVYKKLVVARPVVPMGRDIGFLPGDKDEKLRPWMQPIYDNLEYIFNARNGEDIEDIMVGFKNVEVEALTYIRGRSIAKQFIIIDEAQNLSRHEMKTIVSRVGEGSKIVLIGDPEQIDNPYLDYSSNGLSYVVEKFKDQPLAGHVNLIKGERSPLAQLAAELL